MTVSQSRPLNVVAALLAALSGNRDYALVERNGERYVESRAAAG